MNTFTTQRADSRLVKLFKLATAPSRFALRQTRTNIKFLRDLGGDYRALQPALERATEETLANISAVLVAAEQSLPKDLENMTPSQRAEAVNDSLSRSEYHLLAALGELYKGYRLLTDDSGRLIIENPPQTELERS